MTRDAGSCRELEQIVLLGMPLGALGAAYRLPLGRSEQLSSELYVIESWIVQIGLSAIVADHSRFLWYA